MHPVMPKGMQVETTLVLASWHSKVQIKTNHRVILAFRHNQRLVTCTCLVQMLVASHIFKPASRRKPSSACSFAMLQLVV
mmetsp:Transcript_4061/g.11580  ORF Transcript_4061/g.11580 Transcript_4061/m.11580 type:complete len:80 (+) Transcript_4061:1359-1598(+)